MAAAEQRVRLTRAEQQARTREALLDAAVKVFVERGFYGASVEAITAEAGYTRGAFYSNFDSKEQLFAALLQDRGFSFYRQIAVDSRDPSKRPSSRELGETVAEVMRGSNFPWAFRLFLELLAHAGRDEQFRKLAAGFWTGTRAAGTSALASAWEASGRKPPVAPEHLVTAMIALDVGLALQHFVDPKAVPLGLYPKLFDLLFSPFEPAED